MRYLAIAALVMFLTDAAAAAGSPTPAQPYDDGHWTNVDVAARPLTRAAAPADQYFGRLKLSNLGVRNVIHDITIEGDSPLAIPKQIGRLAACDSALVDWANKYPRDRWLPSAMLKLAKLLKNKQQASLDAAATGLLFYMSSRFAGDRYGKQALQLVREYEQTPNFDVLSVTVLSTDTSLGDSYFQPPWRK